MHPWQQHLEALKAGFLAPGTADADTLKHISGLEFLQRMIRGELPVAPITQTLDFYLIEAEPGRAVFQGRPARAYYNPIATVHGGYHATLLDSAMACAVQTLCEAGRAYTTLEFKIHFVRPLTEATGPVRAEGKVVSSGRRMATAEGRLVDGEGRLYSHGTTTCMLFDLQP
jgi:uncharacterized protein (TIGR00369 family)